MMSLKDARTLKNTTTTKHSADVQACKNAQQAYMNVITPPHATPPHPNKATKKKTFTHRPRATAPASINHHREYIYIYTYYIYIMIIIYNIYMVAAFNPSEKYMSDWEGLSHILRKIKRCVKPPTRFICQYHLMLVAVI